MKKLYRVEVTKTITTDALVYAEDRVSAENIAEDINLDFSYGNGDYEYSVQEISKLEQLEDWERKEIPYSSGDEDRTCEEIFNEGEIEESKWVPPKSQLSLQF